jgi:molybdate transport repressor ModE-like protein
MEGMTTTHARHAYKEIKLAQLRSFCETARLGSLTAAATSLGLAQPTVWEQVHGLERLLEVKLVEREAHGCRLTDAGRLVLDLAAPLVTGIDSLAGTVARARQQAEVWLTVAATQRILTDDLPETVVEFERLYPHVRLRLLEMSTDQVSSSVQSREADLGLTLSRTAHGASPWLVSEPCYELDLILVTPKRHPLAAKKRLSVADLADYPLVNSPESLPDPAIQGALDKLGVFRTQPRRVEAYYTSVIRRYVELGFGIGLVLGRLDRPHPASPLAERSMRRQFGPVAIHQVRRKGEPREGPASDFARMVREHLH